MTRTAFTGAVAAAAMLAAPAAAFAHGDGHDHGRHDHGRHHHRFPPAPPAIGTVAAFADGQLTVTLNNGKSYDGAVTARTVVICAPAPPATTTPSPRVKHHFGGGSWSGRCSSADLVAGAKVAVAKLSLAGDGATWKKVELLK